MIGELSFEKTGSGALLTAARPMQRAIPGPPSGQFRAALKECGQRQLRTNAAFQNVGFFKGGNGCPADGAEEVKS